MSDLFAVETTVDCGKLSEWLLVRIGLSPMAAPLTAPAIPITAAAPSIWGVNLISSLRVSRLAGSTLPTSAAFPGLTSDDAVNGMVRNSWHLSLEPELTDPKTMHELQKQFATQEGEDQWMAVMHEYFHMGELNNAQRYLEMQLQSLDTELATRCLIDDPDRVSISGWEELQEAIELAEGDAITGITLAIANEADRAFEKGQVHHPYMMLGLYSDDPFAFSQADEATLIEQALAEEGPAWAGYDEDIEVFLECNGLSAINTALVHHKERHFFRDNAPEEAPKRYVEYVLACWWRALLFHRAVEKICRERPLPNNVPVLTGMVDMKPDAISVHGVVEGQRPAPRQVEEAPQMAELLPASMITRREAEEIKEPPSGADLRKRLAQSEPEPEPEKKGLMARLFGRN